MSYFWEPSSVSTEYERRLASKTYDPGMWWSLKTTAANAFDISLPGNAAFESRVAEAEKKAGTYNDEYWQIGYTAGEEIPNPHAMTEEAFKQKGYDRGGAIKWSPRMTEQRAQIMAEDFDKRQHDAELLERNKTPMRTVLGFGAAFLGGLPDPINFIPVGGMAAKGASLGRRVYAGAKAGVLGTAVADAVLLPAAKERGIDVGFDTLALDMTFGALFGGAIGAGGHWLHSRRVRSMAPQEEALGKAFTDMGFDAAEASRRAHDVVNVLADTAQRTEKAEAVRSWLGGVNRQDAGRLLDKAMATLVKGQDMDVASWAALLRGHEPVNGESLLPRGVAPGVQKTFAEMLSAVEKEGVPTVDFGALSPDRLAALRAIERTGGMDILRDGRLVLPSNVVWRLFNKGKGVLRNHHTADQLADAVVDAVHFDRNAPVAAGEKARAKRLEKIQDALIETGFLERDKDTGNVRINAETSLGAERKRLVEEMVAAGVDREKANAYVNLHVAQSLAFQKAYGVDAVGALRRRAVYKDSERPSVQASSRVSLSEDSGTLAREGVRAGEDGQRVFVEEQFQGAGPTEHSVVAGPATLYQWQNLPEWKQRLVNWMRDEKYSQEEIDRYIRAVEAQMTIIEALGPKLAATVVGANQATRKKKSGGIAYSGPVRSNADEIYLISFDASSMCVKRLSAAKTAKMAEEALGRPLTVDESLALIALYRAAGKEAPCVYCYVESNRRKATQAVGTARDVIAKGKIPAKWGKDRKAKAQAAIDEFRKAGLSLEDIKADYVLDPAVGNKAEALEAKGAYPAIYEFMNSEALATKQNQVKLYEEYRGELLDLTADQVEMLNGYAGIRFFSSSDFQIEHLVDLIQSMWDMHAKKAKSHAYTKVPLYVKIFGRTGQKINMSCFAKEDPVTGEIRPDIAQGWDWKDAREMRDKYEHCGVVFVTSSDKILRWAMQQDWIDYVIPFHYSGLEKKYYETLGWQDFTAMQMEQLIYKDKTPKGVTKGEVKGFASKDPAVASVEYAKLCFDRKAYPIKIEEVFTDIANDATLNSNQKRKAAQERWQKMVEEGEFKSEDIDPNYFTKRLAAGKTTKDKPMYPVGVPRVRMHEIVDRQTGKSTIDGLTTEQGTRAYLELCLERKIYPVFPSFCFKDEVFADFNKAFAEKMKGKKGTELKKLEATRRREEFKLAKAMWKEMVDKGEIDWSKINTNAFKFKKDYARTDTKFDIVDPTQIDMKAAEEPLRQTLEKGLDKKYQGDSKIAQDLVTLSRYAEANKKSIGTEALAAARAEKDPVAAIMGTPERETHYLQPDETAGREGTTLNQEAEAGPRGIVDISNPEPGSAGETYRIFLSPEADASTVPHESAHIFYRELENVIANAEKTGVNIEQARADLKAIRRYAGVAEEGKLSADDYRKVQEAFARGFEQYLYEGKAPNAALEGVFRRMARWLSSIYEDIKRYVAGTDGVELKDEIRQVYDRMLDPDRWNAGERMDEFRMEGASPDYSRPAPLPEVRPDTVENLERASDDILNEMGHSPIDYEATRLVEQGQVSPEHMQQLNDANAALEHVDRVEEASLAAVECIIGAA